MITPCFAYTGPKKNPGYLKKITIDNPGPNSPKTARRISDIVAELDMFGIINAKVISKGRHGRTREISLATPQATIPQLKKMLEEGLEIA